MIKTFMFFCNKTFGVNTFCAVFLSFYGRAYSGNPKAISEKLHQINPDIKIIWLFQNPDEMIKIIPNYVIPLKYNSFMAFKALATSKFWIDDNLKSMVFYKSKKQIYIQTWHGDRGFKKIYHDSCYEEKKSFTIFESKRCDCGITGSNYGEKRFRSAFKYSGLLIKEGCPRNDLLIEKNPKKSKFIKHRFAKEGEMILLFAPTFRKEFKKTNSTQKIQDIDLIRVLKALEKATNQKWLCLVKAHIAVEGFSDIPTSDKIIDVSKDQDMNELLLISDLLITDYSSCAGDFALLKKPIILFQSDREKYINEDKTLNFKLEDSPFIVAMNQKELENVISGIKTFDFNKNCQDILDFYGAYETGHASESVANFIVSHL